MTAEETCAALGPVFLFLCPKEALTAEQWDGYALALDGINPGDLDEAIQDLMKTYAFRSLPLPAEILRRCDVAKRNRIDSTMPVDKTFKAEPSEGEWKTFTIPGIGSIKFHVLPDDHPALKRYACLVCMDSSWAPGQTTPMGNESVQRCHCWRSNPVLQRHRQSQARYVKEQSR